MAKIDIDKFVVSLLNGNDLTKNQKYTIHHVLQEQGLRIKDGGIVSIKPEIEWYKCINEYRGFIVGKLYHTNKYGDLPSEPDCHYTVMVSNPYFKQWFRPATEEEIAAVNMSKLDSDQKPVPPKIQQIVNDHFYEMLDDDSQRMVSAKAKEDLLTHSKVTKTRDQDKMTEFEKAVEHLMGQVQCGNLVNLTVTTKEQSKNLLSIARKQFIREACSSYCNICETKECCGTFECGWVKQFRKALEKG